MNNTFMTAHDVLENARSFRQELNDLYGKLAQTTENKKLSQYFSHMQHHEEQLEKTMAAYEQEGMESKLETWLQYGPDEKKLSLPAIKGLTDDMSIPEAERIVLPFEEAVADYYTEAAQRVQTGPAQDLFKKLAQKQHQEVKHLKQASEAFQHNA